jgi:hypothetical protein
VKDRTGMFAYHDIDCAPEELEVPEELDPHFSLRIFLRQLPFTPHQTSQQVIVSTEQYEIDFHKPQFLLYLTPINAV